MVRALLLAAQAAVRTVTVQIYEVAGAACVTVGAAMWEPAAAWVVVGVALLGKSLEHDLAKRRADSQ